ncbi:MAG: hypothetical protein K9K67_10140 [Bacteriovoracaceae bacterium]|nr:hypothetical protein [Bacteriovoracaceae bacterium]
MRYLVFTGLFLFSSCSFYSVLQIKDDGQVGYLKTTNCSSHFFGFQGKVKKSIGIVLAESAIDQITMIEQRIFFPLIPIFYEDCQIITGNASMTKEERKNFQALMNNRLKDFNKGNK